MEERQTIRRVINGLAFGDMLAAVSQCDDLVKLKSLEEFNQPSGKLMAVQDRIIDVLRKLLDVARHAEEQDACGDEETARRQPARRRQGQLEEIRNKLDKFLEQQKKVIEASENLAKIPVEDFTKQQEEALKAGRPQGRLGLVLEGPAFRLEQTARAGFCQFVAL